MENFQELGDMSFIHMFQNFTGLGGGGDFFPCLFLGDKSSKSLECFGTYGFPGLLRVGVGFMNKMCIRDRS